MSLAIENLKFTIFGGGFDSTRNDSGKGVVSTELDLTVYSAVIDSSGDYAWFVTNNGLKKYSTRTWEEVEHDVPDSAFVIHPNNVNNNYGVAFKGDGTEAYVFDMTDDTYVTFSVSTGILGTGLRTYDCILVDHKIHIIDKHMGNTNLGLLTLNLSDMSASNTNIFGNVGACGFVNDSVIYACYTREWFYQNSCAYGIGLSGSTVWSSTAIDRNDYLSQWAICANGKIYLPVLIDGTWHFGEFNGTSTPTFSPVTPNRYFGEFENAPDLFVGSGHNDRNHYVTMNDGRTKACMFTSQGLLFTDFSSVDVLIEFSQVWEENIVPLAMNDDYIICTSYGTTKLYIYGI